MIFYDFEVFKFNWLVVFKNAITNEREIIIDDTEKLRQYYEANKHNLFVGFNNKRYDNYIFKGILIGACPYEMTQIIIEENDVMKLFRKYRNLNSVKLFSIDIAQDSMRGSLKEFEGYMGLDIDETSVPFDIQRPLTPEEIQLTVDYCIHDVEATIELANRRGSDLTTKFDLIKEFKLDKGDLDKTNAQLAAKILKAKRVDRDDEFKPFDFSVLDIELTNKLGVKRTSGVSIKNDPGKPCTILEFFSEEYDYSQELYIDIGGVPHIIKFGGLHGALPAYQYIGEIWLADVESYYPSMMIQYDFLSRNVAPEYRAAFKTMYETRIEAKHTGNKRLANILKLVINTIYGAMKAKFNDLYDPHNLNNVCVAGQTMLVELVEKLGDNITLIQSNTDGIAFIPHNKTAIEFIIRDWSRRTRMNMEIKKYKKVFQKDVNNYIIVKEDDSLELKGAFVAQSTINGYKPGKMTKTGKIIDDAVVNYFVNNISPEETINASNDLGDFQIIKKTGWTYDKTVIEYEGKDIAVNKVNRVFATLDKRWGKLYKIKVDENNNTIKRDSHATLPDHCQLANNNVFDMRLLDRSWYIAQAYDRIAKYNEVEDELLPDQILEEYHGITVNK